MTEDSTSAFSAIGFLLALFFIAAVWLLSAYILFRVGKKFGVGSFWEYLIPIYNNVLICRCAAISPLNVIWLFVPIANLIFLVYLWGSVAQRLGHNFWIFGLGIFILGIPVWILAFDNSKPVTEQQAPVTEGPTIYCLSGEFAGNRVPLTAGGIIIGRNPSKANLVLSSLDISAMHARVWCDRENRVWVQDMSSSNGTFYSKVGTGTDSAPEWVEVKGPVALAAGSHLRLGDNVAEFVVS